MRPKGEDKAAAEGPCDVMLGLNPSKSNSERTFMKATLPISLAAAGLIFTACDTRVNTSPAPPSEKNTTIVNPPAEKKESNTTIVTPPAAPTEKKTETNTTITPGGATQQKTETTK